MKREGRAWCQAIFGQKLPNTRCDVGRCAHKSPVTKWTNTLSLQNKFTEAERSLSQQHQLVHDIDGFLEYSPSGGSQGPTLQKTTPVFLGSPLYFSQQCHSTIVISSDSKVKPGARRGHLTCHGHSYEWES